MQKTTAKKAKSRTKNHAFHPAEIKLQTEDDITCPICCDHFEKAVLLPCFHRLCKICLENICTLSNIECPLCRKRLNTWTRTNKIATVGADKFIDEKFQNLVDEFKIELDKFQTLGAPLSPTSGGSNGNGSYSFSSYGTVSRQISNYGEIGADFKNEQGKIDEQLKKLEEESREYIATLLKQEEEEKLRQQEQQNKLDEELAKKLHLELNKAALNANLNSPESPKQNRVMTRNRKNQLNKYGMSKSYANLNSLMSTPSSVPAGKSSSKIFRTGGKNSGSSQKATGVPKNQNNASAFNSVTEKGNAENLPITESEKENFQIPEQSSRASGSKKVNTRHRRTSRKVLAPKIFNSASAVRPESLKLTKSSSVKRRLNEMTFSPESIHELQSSVKDLNLKINTNTELITPEINIHSPPLKKQG